MGSEFQFAKMKRIMQTDGGDGCVPAEMLFAPLNCVLGNRKFLDYFTTVKNTPKQHQEQQPPPPKNKKLVSV